MKNGILVLVGMALWSSPVPAQDLPRGKAAEPLPKELVETWNNAGAEAGSLSDSAFTFLFRPEGAEGPLPRLPAFHFGDSWRVGLVAKLPVPATPFGLSFVNMTDSGLKDLTRM